MRSDVRDLAASTAAGESAASRLEDVLSNIDRRDRGDGGLHAFLHIDAAGARTAAAEIDRVAGAGGVAGPLAGVPIAVKDNICTLGTPTTCGSRILADYRSPFEATVVRRLREAGGIMIGKTNLDEFGMGSSTENSAFGPTRNPHDTTRVPGGSSGGSAAAVATGFAAAALGSETGGSVRQPAAFCGVVGLKPGYGRVSRHGLVAFASSLDQVGVFGASVLDAATVLQVIAGPDPLDATCANTPVPDFTGACAESARDLVVGVPREYFPDELHEDIAALCRASLDRMRQVGAEIREVSLPHTRHAIPTYYVIAPAEASSNLSRYDGVRYGTRGVGDDVYEATRSAGFGEEVKRRIMLGTFALSAGYHDQYYGRAQRVRRLIAQDFDTVFATGVDVLFTPTAPTPAFRLGERIDDPYAMYLSDVFTVTANLAALPALSVPIGTVDGLPVGGQFIAPRWGECAMLRAAAALEREVAG